MSDKKKSIRKIWGFALILMGVALVLRVPEIIERLKDHPVLASGGGFVSFCFYFISLVLVVGGVKKVISSRNDND